MVMNKFVANPMLVPVCTVTVAARVAEVLLCTATVVNVKLVLLCTATTTDLVLVPLCTVGGVDSDVDLSNAGVDSDVDDVAIVEMGIKAMVNLMMMFLLMVLPKR